MIEGHGEFRAIVSTLKSGAEKFREAVSTLPSCPENFRGMISTLRQATKNSATRLQPCSAPRKIP